MSDNKNKVAHKAPHGAAPRTREKTQQNPTARWVAIAVFLAVAFFASYRFALAAGGDTQAASAATFAAQPADTNAGGVACACCGGSADSTPVEGSATQDADGVQRISVDLSTGAYNPNTLKLKAGVPAEITFGQSSGCTEEVVSQDLGFDEDLTGGPKTVKLPPLQPGTYSFSCGMQMVFGSVVVE